MVKNYFGTHIHTEFSNVTTGADCMNKLSQLIDTAKELGMSGIAITNHDNLSEAVRINKVQQKLKKDGDDFNLAIGNEIYLIDDYEQTEEGKAARQKYYHFILIAKDKIGYQALVELSTRAWYRSEIRYGRRRVATFKKDIEEVMTWAKGHLVASTACLGGELPTLLMAEKEDEAKKFVDWCTLQFGENDFYIELQPSSNKDQIGFNKKAIELFLNKVKFLIATDAHYLKAEDFPIFEAFLRSKQEDREVKEFYDFARLMESSEIYSLMSYCPDDFIDKCLNNTIEIGNSLESYDLLQVPKIPKVKNLTAPEFSSAVLAKLPEIEKYPTLSWALKETDLQTVICIRTCLNELDNRDIWNTIYLERLEEEFDTMKFQSESLNDNFFAYAVTMKWTLDLAWEIDCAVGPSRGSASGSLLNYLMDIVILDPIKYELPFWRYLNKTRTSPLDIDTDFQPSKREALWEAIREDRGELGLTQVATFTKLTLKSAINSAARGYRSKEFPKGLDSDISGYLSSLIEIKRGFVATLKQTINGDPITGFGINHMFVKECSSYPGLLDIIEKIESLIVGSGTHAAAVVLFDDEDKLTDHCSLMRSPKGDLCTCLDLHDIEDAGAYKYDHLALSTLDIQATCFKLLQKDNVIDKDLTLKECFRKYINPNTIDYDSPEIWEALYNNTVLSIFQWDAPEGRKGALATRPQSLSELTAANGLIRLMTEEGQEDQVQRFIRIQNDPKLFEEEMVQVGLTAEQRQIMHEELDRYNGCAAMQESFMVLVQRLAGFTLKQADALRKTVAKKQMKDIELQKDLFYDQLSDSTNKVKDYLWSVVIAPSLGYGFSLE